MVLNSRIGGVVLLALLLGGLLIAASLQRSPTGSAGEVDQPIQAPTGADQDSPVDAAAVRSAIDRLIPWMETSRLHPTAGGLDEFRFYVLELRTWHLLALYEIDPARREALRRVVQQRLSPLEAGDALVALLEGARVQRYIADLLVLMAIAADVDYSAPSLDRALPELVREGLDAPLRPVPLQIALVSLIRDLGLEIGPTVEALRPRGMLRLQPPRDSLDRMQVYFLTHEVFGLSDYGLRPMKLDPGERAYLERSLPFWSQQYRAALDPDLLAEIVICDQVVGTTDSAIYRDAVRFLLACQSPNGYFMEPPKAQIDAQLRPADRMHLQMVVLQALLGHEALLVGRRLPG